MNNKHKPIIKLSLYNSKEETIIKSIVFLISAATTFFPAYYVIVSFDGITSPQDQIQYSGFALTTFVYSLTLFMEGSTIKNTTSFFSKSMVIGLEFTAATLLISSLGIISVSNKADFKHNIFSVLPHIIICTTIVSMGIICFNLILYFLYDINLLNKTDYSKTIDTPSNNNPEYQIRNIHL